jgi:hypothetical protein
MFGLHLGIKIAAFCDQFIAAFAGKLFLDLEKRLMDFLCLIVLLFIG